MKHWPWVVGGVLVAGVAAVAVFHYPHVPLVHESVEPAFVVVGNDCDVPVSVRLETDVGESYGLGEIAAGHSVRRTLGRSDMLVWAVALFPDGRVISSEKCYTTSGIGGVSVRVAEDSVRIRYEEAPNPYPVGADTSNAR